MEFGPGSEPSNSTTLESVDPLSEDQLEQLVAQLGMGFPLQRHAGRDDLEAGKSGRIAAVKSLRELVVVGLQPSGVAGGRVHDFGDEEQAGGSAKIRPAPASAVLPGRDGF